MTVIPPRSERLRHLRKYADGNLGRKSFFFRGRYNRMNLRAENLGAFCNLLAGIDDDTLVFHLWRGDYADWFRGVVQDTALANEAKLLANSRPTADEARRVLIDAIDRRYVLRP
jgi:hypothetical protein